MRFLKTFVHVDEIYFFLLKYSRIVAIAIWERSIAIGKLITPMIWGKMSIKATSVIKAVRFAMRFFEGCSSLNILAFLMLTHVDGIIAKLMICVKMMLGVKAGNKTGMMRGATNTAVIANPIDSVKPIISTSRLTAPPDLSGRR